MIDLEQQDAIVADAIEVELRRWFADRDPLVLRVAAEAAAKRARRDLAEVEASGREYREAADA